MVRANEAERMALEEPCLSDEAIVALVGGQCDAGRPPSWWAHVDRCDQCQCRAAAAMAAQDDDAPPTYIHPEPVEASVLVPRGTSFGRYVVLNPLGKGGMGEVYTAYDPDLDRKVAIKLLREHGGGQEGLQSLQLRLVREAQALARLNHPNAVAVYDVGSTRVRVFIAMELVTGTTLQRWARETQPTWEEVLQIMLPAGRALAAAHAAGIIHRDFKPANVMVTKEGVAKVLDFGLARGMKSCARANDSVIEKVGATNTGRPLSMNDPISEAGAFIGTPGYMAPEQYDPCASLDERLDQFSFCVSLYEAIYRQRLFRGTTVTEAKNATVACRVEPPPDGPSAPPWLQTAMERGLRPSPDERFPSMDALLAALSPEPEGHRRLKLLAGSVGFAALLATGAVWTGAVRQAAPHPNEISTLSTAARAAAAKAYFVYPPTDNPDDDTAYSRVVQLEELEGDFEPMADEEAEVLRKEFSATLTRLGDRYWEQEGGRPFAADYYAQALLFDQDNAHAQQRSLLTLGQLSSLEDQARAKSFSLNQLWAAAPLAALADPDDDKRIARLEALYSHKSTPLSMTASRQLEAVVDGYRGVSAVQDAAAPLYAPVATPPRSPATDANETVAPASRPATTRPQSPAGPVASKAPPKSSADPRRDSAAAKKNVANGRAAFSANRFESAEMHFHQALKLDSRSRGALSGLAVLHFERGQYRTALKFAKRGLRLSSRDADLRVLAGDAHFKLLEYAAARTQYKQADDLGHPKAANRLARLARKTGG